MTFPRTIPENALAKARTGRASAYHLERMVTTRTLTEADGQRLLKRIREGFDAVLGEDPNKRPTYEPLRALDGGRK